MDVAIRPALPGDIDSLVKLNGEVQDLHAKLFPDVFRCDWRRSELEAFWRSRLSTQGERILVAEADGSVIGYLWMEVQQRPQDALRYARRRIYIHHICVVQSCRGQGVGRRLLDSAGEYAQETGCSRLLLDVWFANSQAREVFEHAKFEPLNVLMTLEV